VANSKDTAPYDAGDEAVVSKRKTKVQLTAETEVEDLRRLLETKEGRRVLWRILSYCGVYDNAFTGNSTTFFNNGRQDVGKWLIKELLRVSNKSYVNLQLSALNEEDKNG
jgi:hypothetical protein